WSTKSVPSAAVVGRPNWLLGVTPQGLALLRRALERTKLGRRVDFSVATSRAQIFSASAVGREQASCRRVRTIRHGLARLPGTARSDRVGASPTRRTHRRASSRRTFGIES